MFFLGAGEDKNIIKVDYVEDVNVATERTINIGLESGRGISQTKGYDEVFVMPIAGTKSCLLLVTFSYSYPVVGVS